MCAPIKDIHLHLSLSEYILRTTDPESPPFSASHFSPGHDQIVARTPPLSSLGTETVGNGIWKQSSAL